MQTKFAFFIIACIYITEAYQHYRNRIPNGGRIPHPCKPNYMWYGIGHNNSKGSGPRNVFGERFKYWGYEWNKCLCQEDSDGDGLTNGEELGDPNCVWNVSAVPAYTTGISHPGICTPYDSELCAPFNTWLDCSVEEDFDCDAANDSDVEEILLQMPSTPVPTRDTTYMCAAFDLRAVIPAGNSHLIAVRGHIDNSIVMHHILTYACPDDNGPTALSAYSTPRECGMVTSICSALIGMWSVGQEGICYHNNSGVPLGTNGYKYIILQYHWNNPELRNDYTDGSGMTFYVTSNQRTYDSGILFVGPVFIQIPPRWESFDVKGGCSSTCMNNLLGDQSMWVTHVLPHMHYTGKSLSIHIKRAGQDDVIINITPFFYDDPTVLTYNEPFEIRPGDEINVTCTFNSKDSDHYIYFGQATADEMCFAVFIYYPFANPNTFCTTTNGYGSCAGRILEPFSDNECDYDAIESNIYQHYMSLTSNCNTDGLVQCSQACNNTIQNIYSGHNCLTGKAKEFVMQRIYRMGAQGREVVHRLAACYPIAPPVIGDGGYTVGSGNCGVTSGGVINGLSTSLIIVLFLAVIGSIMWSKV